MSCDCSCKSGTIWALDREPVFTAEPKVTNVMNSGHRRDGLYDKFVVYSRRTGSLVDTFTFTLIPGGDPYADVALLAYANAVSVEAPQLARDIKAYLRGEGVPAEFNDIPE